MTFIKNLRLYNAKVARWIHYLEQFQYEIEHIKGTQNVIADILSRYPPEGELLQEEKTKVSEILYMESSINKNLLLKLKNMTKLQQEDSETKQIIQHLQDQTLSRSLTKIEQNCTLDNDILYFTPNNSKRRVFYLPETLREELILQVHEEMGHQEMYKMIKYIKDRFYWKGIRLFPMLY